MRYLFELALLVCVLSGCAGSGSGGASSDNRMVVYRIERGAATISLSADRIIIEGAVLPFARCASSPDNTCVSAGNVKIVVPSRCLEGVWIPPSETGVRLVSLDHHSGTGIYVLAEPFNYFAYGYSPRLGIFQVHYDGRKIELGSETDPARSVPYRPVGRGPYPFSCRAG